MSWSSSGSSPSLTPGSCASICPKWRLRMAKATPPTRQGSVYLGRTEIQSHLRAQAGDREPRPELGGPSRTELESLLQDLDEVPDTVVDRGVRTYLDLHTTQVGRIPAVSEDLRLVECDLGEDDGILL